MSSPPTLDRTATLAPRPDEPAACGEPARQDVELDDLAADDPDRYEQVNEHGRGGLGRVVRAVDRRLGRTVAVKELLRHDPANEARFLREAMITARLEHPGIVPVHEAGRWPNGDPYYVMKLVEGRTLKERICESPTLRERLGLLSHVIAVADAVGYAHSEGVIHRDLKPSNVIVGAFGETIVVDWGLARDRKRDLAEPTEALAAAGSGLSTVSGKVVGTPAYMSPEQARGDVVDERADVYALGAVLYELLAGSPPHADTTPQAVLDRVIAGPPRPLPLIVPSLPGELATIVRKAMARDPDARYPNALALAEDLRRFTTGKLVSAHSYSTWALIRKRVARHRGVVAVAVASVLVLGAVGVESVRRVVAERNIARSQRGLAEDALTSAEKRKRELVLLQAETALVKDPTAALAWLKTYDIQPEDRGKVVDVIDEALALGVSSHVFRAGDWVIDARFTPDGATVVAAVRDGSVRTYDVRTGASTVLGRAPSSPEALALSPDGAFAIIGGALGEVTSWPLHGGAPRQLAAPAGRPVVQLEVSADGRLLVDRKSSAPQVISLRGGASEALGPPSGLKFAVASEDWSSVVMMTSANEVAIPDRATGVARLLARTDKPIETLAISPCGDTVLLHDGSTVWLVPYTGGALRAVARYDDRLRAAVWSPDHRTIALGGFRSEILLIDAASFAVRELRGHGDAIYTLEFTRDSALLLSASDDATARVWRLADGTSLVLRGHDDDVYTARFSADERSVVTSSLDSSARIWPLDRPSSTMYAEAGPIRDLRLDRGQAVVRTPTAVARWDLESGAREQVFATTGDAQDLSSGAASLDGAHAVLPRADGSLELYSRGAHRTLLGHRGLVTRVEFTRDSAALYSASADGTLRRWDLATGTGAIVLEGATPIRGFAIALDGRIAVQAGDLAYLIDAAGEVTRLGQGGKWCVASAEFDAVTDRLVIRRCDSTLAIVDRRAGSAAGSIDEHGGDTRITELATGGHPAGYIAMSPDGRRMAAPISDRTIRIWDTASGQVIDTLRGHSDLVLDVAFSPDGTKLASASYDKTIGVWDLASGRHRVLRGHTASVTHIAWRSPEHLVTASPDGTIRLWAVPSLALPSARAIAEQLSAATSAQIDRDRPATRGT